MSLNIRKIETDILIIGGGTSGCYAAITAAEESGDARILIAEKADIKRSGCLAAGVNALNAYIVDGQTPDDYLNYIVNDSEGIIRKDLAYTISKKLNDVTHKMESLGLVILKDENGRYVSRGNRNIKINGENIKPLLAGEISKHKNISVQNRLVITDYIVSKGRAIGAHGFSLDTKDAVVIYAKAVICATGGASGLYRPNNPGFSRHKMWYSPFNTGAGYAMGIRAGAEMTTFEMRFIALRCKDTIAPTGTIAQGVMARQINSLGDEYETNYGKPSTHMRLYSTVEENLAGRGPCYLKTAGISEETESDLYKAYLNMAPAQTLRWIEGVSGPSGENVEIEGTEPYIVGGHASSGYWIDTNRRTTIEGLYAAGDVAGGSAQKYVTGCFVEGEIAAKSALSYIEGLGAEHIDNGKIEAIAARYESFLGESDFPYSYEEIEDAMQKTMDIYAGGISSSYKYNEEKLSVAKKRIDELIDLSEKLKAEDFRGLMHIFEVIDRLYVCKVVIAHLLERKETRWRSFQENTDHPARDDHNWLKYVNSRLVGSKVEMVLRDLVEKDEIYEHKN